MKVIWLLIDSSRVTHTHTHTHDSSNNRRPLITHTQSKSFR